MSKVVPDRECTFQPKLVSKRPVTAQPKLREIMPSKVAKDNVDNKAAV